MLEKTQQEFKEKWSIREMKRYEISGKFGILEKRYGGFVLWEDVEKARQQLKKKCSQILTRYQIQEVIDEVLK